jgi:hypothetical protein
MRTKSATSWRDCLRIHDAAADFPRMSPDEFKAFSEDIKKNGQRVPIAIIERARPRPDGTFHVNDSPLQEVLDGISRLDAMEAAGIAVIGKDGQLHEQVLRTVIDTDEVDPVAYVISANIHRRHLNVEQRQHLLIALIARTPEKSDRQFGKEIGVDHKTIASARTKGETTGEISPVEKRVGKDGKARKQPARKPPKKRERPGQFRRIQGSAEARRREKLGTRTVNKLRGTSLGSAREMDALVELNDGAPDGQLNAVVQQLVDAALAGKQVSAVELVNSAILPSAAEEVDLDLIERQAANVRKLHDENNRLWAQIYELEDALEASKAEVARLHAELDEARKLAVQP